MAWGLLAKQGRQGRVFHCNRDPYAYLRDMMEQLPLRPTSRILELCHSGGREDQSDSILPT